ncbi:hypothetical protein CIPAW_13G156800 [Carya illinoinensis]|uniref:Uncharacterized protein n=1 Tax=Carya illinoinensis TaxID=32201 RepID=A0A8T1NUJ6_CARIL|nr:hypothetical protein CIPAW_13G156800 [Carya illinoinensis]
MCPTPKEKYRFHFFQTSREPCDLEQISHLKGETGLEKDKRILKVRTHKQLRGAVKVKVYRCLWRRQLQQAFITWWIQVKPSNNPKQKARSQSDLLDFGHFGLGVMVYSGSSFGPEAL